MAGVLVQSGLWILILSAGVGLLTGVISAVSGGGGEFQTLGGGPTNETIAAVAKAIADLVKYPAGIGVVLVGAGLILLFPTLLPSLIG